MKLRLAAHTLLLLVIVGQWATLDAAAQVLSPCVSIPTALEGQPLPAPCVTKPDINNNAFTRAMQEQNMALTALPSSGTSAEGSFFGGAIPFGSGNDICPPTNPYCMSSGSNPIEKAQDAARTNPRFSKPVEIGTTTSRNALAGLRDANSTVLANTLNSTIASPASVYLTAIGMTDSGVLAGITGGGQLSNQIAQNQLLAEQNYVQQMGANPGTRDFNISAYYRCIADAMKAFNSSIGGTKYGWLAAVSKCQGGERTGSGINGDGSMLTAAWNPPSSTQAGRLPATFRDAAAYRYGSPANMALYDSLNPSGAVSDFDKHSVVDEIININFAPIVTANPLMVDVAKKYRSSWLEMFGDIEWRNETPGGNQSNTSLNNSVQRQWRRDIAPTKGVAPFANALVREWYENLHRVLYMYCKFKNGEDIPSGSEMGAIGDPDLPLVALSYKRDGNPWADMRLPGEGITALNLRPDFFNELLRKSWDTDSKQRLRTPLMARLSTPGQPMTAQFIEALFAIYGIDGRISSNPTQLATSQSPNFDCGPLKVWDSSNRDNYYSIMNASLNTLPPTARAFKYMAIARVMGQAQLMQSVNEAQKFILKVSDTAEGSLAAEYGRTLIAKQLGTLGDPMELYSGLLSSLPEDIQKFVATASRRTSNSWGAGDYGGAPAGQGFGG